MRRRWLVEGRVQGVFYRESTRQEALRLGGLTGFVRNLPDGRVEVVAEGLPGALEALRAFVGRGPPHARVDGVVETEADPRDTLRGFEVRW